MRALILSVLLSCLAGVACAAGVNGVYAGGSSSAAKQAGVPIATTVSTGGAAGGAGKGGGVGFGCQSGTWKVVEGAIQCAGDTPTSVSVFASKVLLVRVALDGGWISSPVLEVVGSGTDLRLDALSPNGAYLRSCYVYQAGSTCSVGGLNGSANSSYVDQLPDQKGILRYAADFVNDSSLIMSGSSAGSPGGDNYILSASLAADGSLSIYIAGYFTNSATATTKKLDARLAYITFTAAQLAAFGARTTQDATSRASGG